MQTTTRLALGTLLLVAVSGAAGGFAWWFFTKHEAGEKATQARAKRFLAFDAAEATALRVQAKGDDVRLERRGGTWIITAPMKAAADGREVEGLLSRLAGMERRADSAAAGLSAAALADYGLDRPTARFEVTLAGGRTVSLAIGGDNRFDGTMFVQPASGEVVVVDGRSRIDLEKGAFELRERRLLLFEPAEVVKLELTSPAGAVALAQERGTFSLTAPVKEPADARTAEDLVAALRDLKATAFEDGPEPTGAPAYAVRIVRGDGTEAWLRAWRGSAADEPLVVRSLQHAELGRVAGSTLSALDVSPMRLRDRRVLPGLDREAIAAIRVEAPGGGFALARKPGGAGLPDVWTLTAPAQRPLDPWRSQSLAWALAGLEADRIVDGAASPGPVLRTYVLLDAAGAELGRVAVGTPRAGEVLVAGRGRVLGMPADRLAGLATAPDELAPAP